MANHNFNITLAKRYGIEEAILIEHIYWWIHKNECEEVEDMVHEGAVWCRSTAKGFAKYIPYMKPDKIWRILKKLEGRVLRVGNFNRQALNQTLWYTFTDDFVKELIGLDYDFKKNKNAILKNEKSNISNINIPNNENKIKEDNKKRLSNDNPKDELFEKFWIDYGREGSKARALKEWNRLKDEDKKTVMSTLSSYLIYCKRIKRRKKDACSYLHQEYYAQDWNIIPDYYQIQPSDNERLVKFKLYMVHRFKDLIYHRNPLTFEQADNLFKDYEVEKVEQAMDILCQRDIHQYYKVLDGIKDVLNELDED